MLNEDEPFPPATILEFVRGPFDGERREVPAGSFTYVPWTPTGDLLPGYYFRAMLLGHDRMYREVMLYRARVPHAAS